MGHTTSGQHVKLVIDADGNVAKAVTKVHGRKIPLQEIQKESLKKNREFLKIHNDEFFEKMTIEELIQELKSIGEDTTGTMEEMKERLKRFNRTRHWLIWHDHSVIANHGFMLFCLRELYGPAIYKSSQTYLEETGRKINIQATVESPKIYILGASKSTVDDQMQFVKTRQEDLKNQVSTITNEGIEVNEVMRYMNGDNPAIQMESGTQHGGTFPCAGCDCNINSCYSLEYSLQRPYLTLKESQDLILAGTAGQGETHHPYKNLKADHLKKEMRSRGLSEEGKKEEIQERLTETLRGKTRLPALLTTLTYRKLFGIYFHASISHAPFLLRLHSHRSTNAETFERLFEKITDITKKTWGKRLEDLSSNAMLHVSAEINTKETDAVLKALPQMGNATLTKDMLREYAGDWEGHLHQIADFLVPGEGEWWHETEDTVEFHDGNDEISHRNAPALHHFRSSSIPQEQSYLRESWQTCVNQNKKVPALLLRDNNRKLATSSMCCSFPWLTGNSQSTEKNTVPLTLEDSLLVSDTHNQQSSVEENNTPSDHIPTLSDDRGDDESEYTMFPEFEDEITDVNETGVPADDTSQLKVQQPGHKRAFDAEDKKEPSAKKNQGRYSCPPVQNCQSPWDGAGTMRDSEEV
ncbi:predicted protein [Nematostella vectensis]|uniref:SAP domain-containing protein n=1 Tax=Nematostella vectensis TaxID=45351 RepID=A7SXV5_NEMVE|nr:predicted protein [Nematostella vectensis]|eukprot:XP_001623563.1 predicted protein [Nematostella vectensis]